MENTWKFIAREDMVRWEEAGERKKRGWEREVRSRGEGWEDWSTGGGS